MSKVKIEGNASGTGTLTISAPNTNTDRSITLPDGAGEILTDASNISSQATENVPLFKAVRQSVWYIVHNTFTKVPFNTEVYDTDGCYDPTTNYRWTPTTPGYYEIGFSTIIDGHTEQWVGHTYIYKNGSRISDNYMGANVGWGGLTTSGSLIVEANGTTDYFEIYMYIYNYTDGSNIPMLGDSTYERNWFQAKLVRAT